MNLLSKGIAISLIVVAVFAGVYSAAFTQEYTNSLQALAEFRISATCDMNNITNSSIVPVRLTFHNPSDIDIRVYEVDYALFIRNVSTGYFIRHGLMTMYFSQKSEIVIPSNSDKSIIMNVYIENHADALWNIRHSGGNHIVDQYAESYYHVSKYDFKSKTVWGIPHYSRRGGPFD